MSEQDKKEQALGELVVELFSLELEKGRKTSYKTSYGYKNSIGIGRTVNNLIKSLNL